jgi:S-formylglutathione hydrolase FrmB
VTDASQFEGIIEEPLESVSINPGDYHIADVIVANRLSLPRLRFDCGIDDPLIVANRALSRALDAAGVPHRFQEFPGTHDWDYWQVHIEDTFRFFAHLLDKTR